MTKEETRQMLAAHTETFIANGGRIKRKSKVVWARGAKLKRNKSVAQNRSNDNPTSGFTCTNHTKLETMRP